MAEKVNTQVGPISSTVFNNESCEDETNWKIMNEFVSPKPNWATRLYDNDISKIEDDQGNCVFPRTSPAKYFTMDSGDDIDIDDMEAFKFDRSQSKEKNSTLVFEKDKKEILVVEQRENVSKKRAFPYPLESYPKSLEHPTPESRSILSGKLGVTRTVRYHATVNRGKHNLGSLITTEAK